MLTVFYVYFKRISRPDFVHPSTSIVISGASLECGYEIYFFFFALCPENLKTTCCITSLFNQSKTKLAVHVTSLGLDFIVNTVGRRRGGFEQQGLIREGFGGYFLLLTETRARFPVVRRLGRVGSHSRLISRSRMRGFLPPSHVFMQQSLSAIITLWISGSVGASGDQQTI